MAVTISGDTGISAVQAGAVESADLPAGSVIQVVNETKLDGFSTTSSSFVDAPGFSADITPVSTSSKILVFFGFKYGHTQSTGIGCRVTRNGVPVSPQTNVNVTTDIKLTNLIFAYNEDSSAGMDTSYSFLDTPSSTSLLTYQVQFFVSAGTLRVGSRGDDSGSDPSFSYITVMEIAG